MSTREQNRQIKKLLDATKDTSAKTQEDFEVSFKAGNEYEQHMLDKIKKRLKTKQ